MIKAMGEFWKHQNVFIVESLSHEQVQSTVEITYPFLNFNGATVEV